MSVPEHCRRCDHPMLTRAGKNHRGAAERGVREHEGRGLCSRCYCALRERRPEALLDYPRIVRTRDELLDDYRILRAQGLTQAEIAIKLDMRLATLTRALERARAAGERVAA